MSSKPTPPASLPASLQAALQPSGESLLPGEGDLSPSRRAFLQVAGYGLASTALSGCSRGPLTKVIPYLSAPEGIVSGKAYWLATTCGGCTAACGVLAKCRDGRPIKLEGNPTHALSRGGLCAVGQAEVLGLYDSKRFEEPLHDGAPVSWAEVDRVFQERLNRGERVRLLTGSQHGPSTRQAIDAFLAKYPAARHISYEGLSCSAILDAHARTHEKRAMPSPRFDRAQLIVSFDADFLGTWISPVAFAAAYARGRRPDSPEGWMSRHIQLEARLSLSGSAADERVRLAPEEQVSVLAALGKALEEKSGRVGPLANFQPEESGTRVAPKLAEELWEARGRSLVVCGQNSLTAQVLCAYVNELLGNYGKTLSIASASLQRTEDDGELEQLREELESGSVDLLLVSGMNPSYDLPPQFVEAMAKAGTRIAHSASPDETTRGAEWVLPLPHHLESWGDGEPEEGRFSLIQPAIPALRHSRSLRLLLHRWSGGESSDFDLLRATWEELLQGRLPAGQEFESAFDRALHDGYLESDVASAAEPQFHSDVVTPPVSSKSSGGVQLVLYPKIAMLDGRGAHNPWLQELPDPISKVTWDNYACLSPEHAERLGVEDGDRVRIKSGDGSRTCELPALVQRGQHDGVVAVALGYGRFGTDRFAKVGPEWIEGEPTVRPGEVIGVNMAPWIEMRDGNLRYDIHDVIVERAQGHTPLASTQDHHTLEVPERLAPKGHEVRDALRSATFADYASDPEHAFHQGHQPPAAELWQSDHDPKGHHWGMSIDLTSCIGCSACSVSCQAENNVPVVGKDEVLRHREMHWMRIDRYLSGEGDEVKADYQPMFCQQCDNAPCEGVCPVLATVHSSEGLNQQVYNRCVGTRYCANTCPYKVRRFNWFDYPREEHLANQTLNPDVTVRTRGVMEKCSFCSQRIMEAKAEATRQGVELADGDIQVACQQSCPTQAIVFGDLSDPESRVSKLAKLQRSYRVLEELNVKPSVHYLGSLRNREEGGDHE